MVAGSKPIDYRNKNKEELGVISELSNYLGLPSACQVIIPIEVFQRNEYGMLSAKLRFESCQNATNTVSALTFNVDELLQDWTPEAKKTARPLLFAILEAIRDQRAPDFRWIEGNPEKKLEQIHTVFALCDYLCLNQFQQNYLEPFQQRFPTVDLKDIPPTVLHLDMSKQPLDSDFLSEFTSLQYLKLRGWINQEVIDKLPVSLTKLDLDLPGMFGKGLSLTTTEIALAAVSQDGRALQFASDDLKADKEVVLAAVAQNGSALQFASDELKADKEVVLTAVAQNGWALFLASDELQADQEVLDAARSARSNPLRG